MVAFDAAVDFSRVADTEDETIGCGSALGMTRHHLGIRLVGGRACERNAVPLITQMSRFKPTVLTQARRNGALSMLPGMWIAPLV